MKNFISKSVFVLLVSSAFLASCGKYEDGPAFSLMTKKSRLCGDWKIESFLVNETDYTSAFVLANGEGYRLDIEKDGSYHVDGMWPDSGTWELGGDGDDVRFLSSDTGAVEISFRILRLKSKELWLRHTETNGDQSIFKYAAE